MGFTTAVSYSGNLTAFLTIETLDAPMKTVSQLDRSELPIYGFSNFWGLLFEESTNKHLQNLAPRYIDFLHTFPKFWDVAKGEATLIENRQHLLYVKKQYYTNQRDESPLRIMEECIAPYGIGAVLRRNSPLKANMDKVILWLQEAGLMWRFFEETLAEDHWEEGEGSEWIQEQRRLPPPSYGPQPLTLEHMQGAFALMLAGNLVALLVMATEMAAFACRKAPTDKPSK
ncbi:ionotropic receptor 21a-like [Oratosquilla oratoria]|uniref:ionotropic receptor 21a-like n=1 Tax=Oratosquilla oratoria TaxID=337810 RepID=UPI003F76DDEC